MVREYKKNYSFILAIDSLAVVTRNNGNDLFFNTRVGSILMRSHQHLTFIINSNTCQLPHLAAIGGRIIKDILAQIPIGAI